MSKLLQTADNMKAWRFLVISLIVFVLGLAISSAWLIKAVAPNGVAEILKLLMQ